MRLKPRKERVAGKDLHDDDDRDKRPINVAGTSRVGANNNDCAMKPINVAGTSRVGASSDDTARDVLPQPWVKMAKAQRRVTPFSDDEDALPTNYLGRQRKPITPDLSLINI